jgi:SAM-dependent methyltransferase
MTQSNPYRIFYEKQGKEYSLENLENVRTKHEVRAKYYKWYTKDWLPSDKDSPILDIGCGSGQFLYFLRQQGYTNAKGIDIATAQLTLAGKMGLDVHCMSAEEYLRNQKSSIALIAMLDVIEHFTAHELYTLMELAHDALIPGGKIIVSVPNAVSPLGLSTRFSDITHETCFSPATLSQMFFCHDMKVIDFRDPWPAPVSTAHKIWRTVAEVSRRIESFRLKMLGLSAPKYWSPVIWAIAEK